LGKWGAGHGHAANIAHVAHHDDRRDALHGVGARELSIIYPLLFCLVCRSKIHSYPICFIDPYCNRPAM
jgi:hypothetical protein